MINKIFLIILIIGIALFCSLSVSHAQQMMTLPNGQELDVSNLNNQEILDAIKIAKKSIPASQSTVAEMVKGVKLSDLNEWRMLITGTIKDVCNDLSITVNEFVKTPVGLGIAALIIYKVAGKDIMANAFDVIFAIPLWVTFTFINCILILYFFKPVTVYTKITETADKKIIKEGPERSTRYPFKSSDARNCLGGYIMISQILITIICMIIVF
jgi:hypothetical protein